MFSGVLVILSLLFLTPYFSFIPRATLAAIIIAAVIFMVEVKVVKPMWRTKSKKACFNCKKCQINFRYIMNKLFLRVSESDLIPGVGTFIACLVLQLEIGILCGVGINILFILYHAARPKITVEKLKVIIRFTFKKRELDCISQQFNSIFLILFTFTCTYIIILFSRIYLIFSTIIVNYIEMCN